MMNFDELLYFMYMNEQEQADKNRSQNQNTSSTEDCSPKKEKDD